MFKTILIGCGSVGGAIVLIAVMSSQVLRCQNPIVKPPSSNHADLSSRTSLTKNGHSSLFLVKMLTFLNDNRSRLNKDSIEVTLTAESSPYCLSCSFEVHEVMMKLQKQAPDRAQLSIKSPMNLQSRKIDFDLENMWSESDAFLFLLSSLNEHYTARRRISVASSTPTSSDQERNVDSILDVITAQKSAVDVLIEQYGDEEFDRIMTSGFNWLLNTDQKTIRRLFSGMIQDTVHAVNNAALVSNFRNSSFSYAELASGASGPLWLSVGTSIAARQVDTSSAPDELNSARRQNLLQSIIYGGGTVVLNATSPIALYSLNNGISLLALTSFRAGIDMQNHPLQSGNIGSFMSDINLDVLLSLRTSSSLELMGRLRLHLFTGDQQLLRLISQSTSDVRGVCTATLDIRLKAIEFHVSHGFGESAKTYYSNIGMRVSR